MIISIDTNYLDRRKLSINEYLTLFKIYELLKGKDIPFIGKAENVDSLINKGFLEKTDKGVVLTNNGSKVLGTKDSLTELAEKLREMFPKGKKGGQYYWRGTVGEIKLKLKSFISAYGRYSDEDVIKATKRYLDGFKGGNYDSSMQLLKFFIMKDRASTLKSELDNLNDDSNKSSNVVTGTQRQLKL